MKIQNKGDKFQNWLQIGQGAFVVACGCVCVLANWCKFRLRSNIFLHVCGGCTACEEGGLCLCVCVWHMSTTGNTSGEVVAAHYKYTLVTLHENFTRT